MRSSKIVDIHQGPYTIRRSFPQPVPLEIHPKLFKFSNVFTWSLWAAYTVLQFLFARSVQLNSHKILWQMWIVLWAEVALSFQQVVLAFNTILGL